jgi:hypothetical protein
MRGLRWGSVAAAMAVTAGGAAAQTTVCPLETAIRNLRAYTVQFEGKLAEQQQPLLLELQQISAKAAKPDVPINQQVSKADVARFQQLREQSLTLQARSRLSSRHERATNIV